ncbi:MAG: hypothetical protein VW455_03360 [Nitrospinota bacterium]
MEKLQEETSRINKEIVESLEEAKADFSEGREDMRKELENMRKEAKSLGKEISVVLEDQKEIWKEETVNLQDSLMEAKAELAAAQADSGEILESSRAAYREFQVDKVVTMNDSKDKSGKAMAQAEDTLQRSTKDYKKASERTAAEILAQMKNAKDSLKRRQAISRQEAANTNRELLASVQKDKLSRNAELRTSRLQTGADLKKARQFGQAASAESRQAALRRADTQASQKSRLGKTAEVGGDEGTGEFGDRALDARGALESFEDQSDPNRRRRGGGFAGEEDGTNAPLSLEEQKKRLFEFGNRIKILKKQIEAKSGNAAPELIELGNEYLGAQRFIDSRDDIEKLALLKFANEEALPLGSYEQAAWAFKIALRFNNKGDTHLTIGKIYDEINDGKNAIMYAKLAHLVFRQKRNSAKIKEAESFIESLSKKYGDKTS